MKWMLNFAAFVLLAASAAWGSEGLPKAVEPIVTENTSILVKLDLKDWNVDDLAGEMLDFARQNNPAAFAPGSPMAPTFAMFEGAAAEVTKNVETLNELGIDSVLLSVDVLSDDEKVIVALVFPCEEPSEEVLETLDEMAQKLPNGQNLVSVRRARLTDDAAIWFFAPDFEELSSEELLKMYEPADRPDLAEGLQRVEECRLCAVATPGKLPSIEEAEIPAPILENVAFLQENCRSISFGLHLGESIHETNLLSYAIFSEEDAAEKALAFGETFLRGITEDIQADEFQPLALDYIGLFLEFIAYERDGNVLVMDMQKNTLAWMEKYFGWTNDYMQFAAENREARADFDSEAEADRLAKAIAPLVTPAATFVAHLDLERFELAQISDAVLEKLEVFLPRTFASDNPFMDGVQMWESFVEGFELKRAQILEAGGKDVFFMAPTLPETPVPFLVVIPVETNNIRQMKKLQNLAPLAGFLPEDEREEFTSSFVAGFWEGNLVIFPVPFEPEEGMVEELCTEINKLAVDRPQFRDGFALGASDCFQVVFAMNPAVRGLIKNSLDELPEGTITNPGSRLVARGLDVVTLSLDPNTANLRLQAYSKSEAAAENLVRLTELWKSEFLELAAQQSEDAPSIPMDNIQKMFDMVQFVRDGRRVSVYLELPVGPAGEQSSQTQAVIVGTAVTGIAAALLLPAVQQARSTARQMQMTNNMKQVALAMLNHEAAIKRFPSAYTVDEDGKPLHSWRVKLLPYLDQYQLYEQIRLDEPWDSEWNSQFHDAVIPVYQDPRMDLAPGQAVMSVVVGEGTVFDPASKRGCSLSQITDGTSNTVLLVERAEPFCWMDPTADVTLEELEENGLENVLFCPQGEWLAALCVGSVHTLSVEKFIETWKFLFLRADGEIVSPWD